MLIRSESEGRVFECALQFAVFAAYDSLYAASFVGRPAPAQAIAAGLVSSSKKWFTLVMDDGKTNRIQSSADTVRVVTEKIEDVVHVLVLPKTKSMVVLAPDGDMDKALRAWACDQWAVPKEFDYTQIFRSSGLEVIIDAETPWASLQAFKIRSLIHLGWRENEINEEKVLEGIKIALRNGTLTIPPSSVAGFFDPGMTLQEYLKANARIFAEMLAQLKPLHDPETCKNLHPAIVMERIPFPAQAHTIQGLSEAIKRENLTVCAADMGTGKSIISLGVSNVMYHHRNKRPTRVLLSAPGITVPKWESIEIGETLPDANVTVIRSTDDAAHYLRQARDGTLPDGLSFVLVGIDRSKLGPDPWCCASWKRIIGVDAWGRSKLTEDYAWHCPSCGKWLPDPSVGKEGEAMPAGWTLFANETYEKDMFNANGVAKRRIKWAMPPRMRKCPHCNEPIWRPALKSRDETRNAPRWYVSDILKRLGRHFHLYICDEIHQTKAEDSGRGYAFSQMVKASKKTLALTGTLLNGMSTSIKEILWRTDPASLLKLGFDHKTGMVTWASRYGVLERVIRTSEDDEGVVTHRKKVQKQPKERPGIAPELVATHLLHRAVFLELQDLDLPLVELEETPLFVDLEPEHLSEYKHFHKELHDLCARAYAAGNNGAFARFIPATINAVDRADLDSIVEIGKGHVEFTGFGEENFTTKELQLVDIVRKNLAEDRGCVVYTFYTGFYNVHSRLQRVLAKHGIDAEILDVGTSTEDRFEWLQQAAERDVKVFICNLRLVEVGLDLIAWPTLIFFEMSYDINSVRQAARRAWRIGQMQGCRVYYIMANGTQQIAQFESCMSKRAHAMLAEGKLDRSELAAYGRDVSNALAVDLASCIASEDLGRKWAGLAVKDMGIETVKESEFKKVLAIARKKLVNETLTLCGLEPDYEEEPEEETTIERPRVIWSDAFVAPKRRRKPKVVPGQMSIFDLLGIVEVAV